MLKKVPGRRGGGPRREDQPADEPLTFGTPDVDAAMQDLSGHMRKLKVSPAPHGEEAGFTVVIDPQSYLVAPLYARGLERSPRVAKEAGVDAAQLLAVQERVRGLGALLYSLVSLRALLAGSRLVIAAASGVRWGELVDSVMADLGGTRLTEAQRTALKAAAARVLVQVEREGGDQKRRLEELKGVRKEAADRVQAAAERRRQLLGLLELQEGGEIGADLMDELQRIYEVNLRVPAAEQRQARR